MFCFNGLYGKYHVNRAMNRKPLAEKLKDAVQLQKQQRERIRRMKASLQQSRQRKV